MAKLSARGRTELVRLEREREVPSDEDRLTCWEKISVVLMSDCTILQRLDVRFLPDSLSPEGRFHSYGWKVIAKAREPDIEKFTANYVNKGFKLSKKR